MQPEQVKSQIRVWLTGLAGVVLGWFASKGWINEASISAILNSPVVVAVLGMAATAVWSWFSNTDKALVAKVDALAKDPTSPVKGVIVTNSAAGHELTSGTTVVAAGSPQATDLAKT